MSETARILCVDDEPNVLAALQRTLSTRFEVTTATSGERAIDVLASEPPFSVVVSDMRMPGMDGAELLSQAKERFPRTARVILSGYSQYEAALRALPVAHRFLAKPVRNEDIHTLLMRTVALHNMLDSPALRELVGGASDLPARPQVYFQLRRALADASSPMRELARIIERDQGITGRLLRTASNAFFGAPCRVTSVEQAVKYLGTDTLSALVLSLECFGGFEAALANCELVPESLERESQLAAQIASRIVSDESSRHDAFLGGLLHDCGTLLIADRRPELLREVQKLAKEDDCPRDEAERRMWGTTHAEIGAYLLGLWGLPYAVVEAVAYHNAPGKTVASVDKAEKGYADTVFLLSDGLPNTGQIPEPDGIIAKLKEMNKTRKVTINTIGVFASNSSEAEGGGRLLKQIADDSGGVYTSAGKVVKKP